MKDFVKAITAGYFDSANLTGAADPIWPGTGLPESCFLIRIINGSNTAVSLSYDGVNVHEIIPAGLVAQLSFQNNSQPNNKTALLAKASNVCFVGNAGVGDLYFVGYYQEN